MDNKFYISLEAAKLLKEKGYDEKVEYMYDDNVLTSIDVLTNSQIDRYYRNMYGVEFYGAPTKAEAIDWLESKGIIVELSYDDKTHIDNVQWEYSIYYHGTDMWIDTMVCCWAEDNYYKKTRLEAEEAAIIKALELL